MMIDHYSLDLLIAINHNIIEGGLGWRLLSFMYVGWREGVSRQLVSYIHTYVCSGRAAAGGCRLLDRISKRQ